MDYKTELHRHFDEWKSKPFDWVDGNCVMFVMDYIEACTGIDPVESFRKRYKTRTGAYRVMRNATLPGWEDNVLEGFIRARMKECGFKEQNKAFLKTGDIVLTKDEDDEICCAIWSNGRPWGLTVGGVTFGYPEDVIAGWRLPRSEI